MEKTNKWISNKCISRKPFGIPANFSKWISNKCLSHKPFGLRANFSNYTETGVKCISIKQKENFVDHNVFTDKHNIKEKWKVCISKANGSAQKDNGNGKRVIADAFLIEPNTICTETYLVVNTFDNKSEAENFLSYMKTKFFRFMLGLRVATQNISKEKFSWVPDLEDYSAVWTDKELYSHFGLTRQEIAYIESKIKAL